MGARDRGPDVRVPPPFVFVAGWIVAWGLSRVRTFEIDRAGPGTIQQVLGLAMLAAGLGLLAWAAATFRRANTPVVPIRPARLVVTDGPYWFTRNPMYLGLTTGYVGLALLVNQAWPLVVLPVVLVVLTIFVIKREERHLAGMFGAEYDAYRGRVRRWL